MAKVWVIEKKINYFSLHIKPWGAVISPLNTHASPPFRGREWERVTDVHINSGFHERLRQKV